MTTQSEIQEILKFDPQAKQAVTDEEIQQILKFDPVGGTFGPRETPPEGAPTPAPPFPPYPGSHRGYVEPTEEAPSFATMMDASTVDDPITKVGIYAKARGIAVKDIPARYRFSKEGEIEFKTDKGSWQREVGESPGQQLKQMSASMAGDPSIPLGAAGATTGPGTAILGTIAGRLMRKNYAQAVHGEKQTLGGVLYDASLHGLLALGGESVGKLIGFAGNKYINRNAPHIIERAGKEIEKGVLSPNDHARALYLNSLARKHGINLLPHQLYKKANMEQMWIYLRNHPLTANAVQEFDDALEKQTHDAVKAYITTMGGYAEEPYEIGTKLVGASKNAMEEAEDAIKRTAKPYYDEAFDDTPIIDKNALKQERAFYQDKIATMQARTEPDVKAMVQGINKEMPGLPTMKIKGETDAAYQARITKDFKRVTGKEIPTTRVEGDATTVKAFKERVQEIEKIMAGGAPGEGVRVPTIPRTIDITPAFKEIDDILTRELTEGSAEYSAVMKIKTLLKNAGGNARKIDNIKKESIDQILNSENIRGDVRRRMTLIKKQLTTAMDDQLPDYNAARGIYGPYGMRKPLEDLELSAIGVLSKAETVKDIEAAVSKIFGSGNVVPSYENLIRIRKIVMAEDPDLWRRTVGHYIRKQYGKAQAAESGEVINIAGKMHKLLFGGPEKIRAMEAAFGGADNAEYKAFKGLMEVFQRAAGGKRAQSITHFAGKIEENMTGRLDGGFKQFLEHPKQYTIDRVFTWWNDLLLNGRQDELLAALTDPRIQEMVMQIKALKPRSKRFIEALTTMTALTATHIEPSKLKQTGPGQAEPQPQRRSAKAQAN